MEKIEELMESLNYYLNLPDEWEEEVVEQEDRNRWAIADNIRDQIAQVYAAKSDEEKLAVKAAFPNYKF